MEKYQITGMSCAACSARVEKAVSKVEGITSCSVNLLTNSMVVEGNVPQQKIIEAVVAAGYGAAPVDKKSTQGLKDTRNLKYEDELKDTETPKLFKRLIASVCILIPLMYVSMGPMLFHLPLPEFLSNNPIGIGLYELLLTIAIMIINQKFFISGIKGVLHKSPNMDTLVAMGAGAAFVYSVATLFVLSYRMPSLNAKEALEYTKEFYFESAATILTLITVGKTLEAKAKGRTTDALKGLMKLAPKTAVILRDNEEIVIPIEQLTIGDQFIVRPGDTVPVDGKIIDGMSAIDESALTGESIPVDKKTGDLVTAATINQSGYLVCQATRVGEDTTLAQIIQMVSDASSTKAKIAKLADKISGIFVPVVLIIAAITWVVWLVIGQRIGFALARAISVLVISCPCALGLATPVAIMVGNGKSAKQGILFKTAVSLEETGRIQIVALDKTGTITNGRPNICQIIPTKDISQKELLTYAYQLEQKSEHPLAKAIVEKAKEDGITGEGVCDFKAEIGNGLRGRMKSKQGEMEELIGGNLKFVSSIVSIPEEIQLQAKEEAKQGHTPLFFAMNQKVLGIISVADTIKEDSKDAITALKELGLFVVMLTGDNKATAEAIAKEAGVDEVIAEVLPDGKKKAIEELMKKGKVAMVGDGINDALALTVADIGIAIGAGADIAVDAADVVLMKNSLSDVVAAIRLSRKTLKIIRENLFWAFIYNIIGIPLAAGLWIPIFGWTLNPMFGAAAMGLSSFCVVSNALRLNFIRIPEAGTNHKEKKMEEEIMELTVNGMMCAHCEAHVKKALEAIDGVVEAIPNHETNSVEIKIEGEVDVEALKKAIVEAGYEVE